MSDNSISSLQTRLAANSIRKYVAQIKEIRIERQIISRQCAGFFKKWLIYIYIYQLVVYLYYTCQSYRCYKYFGDYSFTSDERVFAGGPKQLMKYRIILNLIKRKYLKILCVSILYLFMTNFQCFYLRKFLTFSKTL